MSACEGAPVHDAHVVAYLTNPEFYETKTVVLDVLGIAFAEAGPRLVRINDRSAVLLHGNLAEELYHGKGTTILKINSHADLIKYADDGGIKSD